jgi:hypothetical protein
MILTEQQQRLIFILKMPRMQNVVCEMYYDRGAI